MAGLSILLSVSLQAPGPAQAAALGAPLGLSTSSDRLPILSWTHVVGAASYVVQLTQDTASAQPTLGTYSTTNRQYALASLLPVNDGKAPNYWRVASRDSSWTLGDFSPWVPISRANYPAPLVKSPTSGYRFSQPEDPATLSWQAVEGAESYDVQISQDMTFADENLISHSTTTSTTYVVASPQVATTYWFRVRARLTASGAGVYTDYSLPRSYEVSSLGSASREEPLTDDTVVDDVVLNWNPIPGAKTYDLQVATDPEFGDVVHTIRDVTGTSYSPPRTLNNDEYYWQVRGRDVAGNASDWSLSPRWRFERAWRDLPRPSHPASSADVSSPDANDADEGISVGNPFYYEWDPVPLASMYKIELAYDALFNQVADTCYTRNTTFTPPVRPQVQADSCMPTPEVSYWWRVTALDQFKDTSWRVRPTSPDGFPQTDQIAFYDAKFTYQPRRVTLTAPQPGERLSLPVLEWEPLAGASAYDVTITPASGGQPITETTRTTSFTPVIKLAPATYRWDVVPVSVDGRRGAPLTSDSQRTFIVEPDSPPVSTVPVVTTPLAGTFARFPSLRWEPVVNAVAYRVQISTNGGSSWSYLDRTYQYPAGQDQGTVYLAPATYHWRVVALSASGAEIGTTPADGLGSFSIARPDQVTGQRNALSMKSANENETCSGLECKNLRQTPLLRWDSHPDAGYYKVWISNNKELSNLVPFSDLGTSANPFMTSHALWMPTTALQERTAGQGYWWAVQACTAGNQCAPTPTPTNSFNKLSNPVDTLSPGVPYVDQSTPSDEQIPKKADDVTLAWRGYLQTNQEALKGDSQLGTRSRQEAREYEVQVATDPQFLTIIDTETVDQRRMTTYDSTYPEGRIYWRVRAKDSSGNSLPWSVPRVFIKRSPVPELNSFTSVQGTTPVFSWKALDLAASYELEVTPTGSTTPRFTVPSNQVRWSASSSAQALSAGSYTWRVRRRDANGRFGDWSPADTFRVSGATPVLSSPQDLAAVEARSALFTWEAVAEAADYRITLQPRGGGPTLSEVTKANAWAPPTTLSPGTWDWTVAPRNPAGAELVVSDRRSFVVGGGPTTTQAARIEGSGQVGTLLVAYDPVWSTEMDETTLQWKRSGLNVGDGSRSYAVTAGDIGQSISLVVTGRKAGSPDTTSTSNAISGVRGAAPVASVPPSINGSPQVGQTLTGVDPSWVEDGVSVSVRQWLVNGSLAGSGSSFVLLPQHLGVPVTFQVRASRGNAYAEATVTSAPIVATTGAPLPNLTPPTISGNGVVGSYLTANPGTWSGGWATTTSFVWLRDGQIIDGATSSLYLTTAADGGKQISIRVTARQTGFADGTATSSPLFIQALMATSPVQLSAAGTGVGATLTAIAPTWNQTTVDTTYQWLRDGQVMWSATGNSYTVSADDVGKTVTVRATGRKAGFPDATSTSNGIVATRGGAPSVVSPPSVTGTARVGNVLTALPGEWTDNPTFSFQWLRNGQPIANASGSTYFATAADAAAKLSVKVTAAKAGREDGVATSPAVTMGKLASTTALGVSPFAVTKRIRAKLAITVAVSGVLGPTGTLVIKDGKKKLKSLSLTASRKGVLVFKMPKLKPGKHKLKVIYGGSTTVSGSKAVLKIVVSK